MDFNKGYGNWHKKKEQEKAASEAALPQKEKRRSMDVPSLPLLILMEYG